MPKQFREIAGIPMLLRSIRPFARHPRVGEIVVAVPVSDTIKRVEPDGVRVLETVERSALWRAQTPQGFPRSALVAAFDRTEPSSWGEFTDEAALVQTAGFPVEVVPDRDGNLKVTTEDDFAMAAFLAARR